MLHLSDTYIAMPVIVHEFVEHAVEPDQVNVPEMLDRRCSLYRVLVPPDKLNPQVRDSIQTGEILRNDDTLCSEDVSSLKQVCNL